MAEDLNRTVAPEQWRVQVEAAIADGFTFVDWLTAVDRSYAQPPAVQIVARVVDTSQVGEARGLRIDTTLIEGASIESLTGVAAGFAFHERETFEMFGVVFDGFDDGTGLGLRPLLLPDGFEGHPLRKDFMLAARASKAWPGGKEPGEGAGHDTSKSPSRRRVQAPGVPPPEWGPR